MFLRFPGFSILELLVVITIISILIYEITFHVYIPAKEKSYVTSDVLPRAEKCLENLQFFCSFHPGRFVNSTVLQKLCPQTQGNFGLIEFYLTEFTCSNEGSIPNFYQFNATSSASFKYYVKCLVKDNHWKCIVEGRE